VHFRPNSWNNRDRQARDVLAKLSQGPQHNVQITYDEPWFWKVFISSAERPAEAPKAPPRPAIKMGEATGLTVDTSVGRHDHMEDGAEEASPKYTPSSPTSNPEDAVDYANIM
tara:strand:+ start:443 stop:781 length:339 start_codon:yes stop_codon:yes gene_type:complete